jgi:hypothetical protein
VLYNRKWIEEWSKFSERNSSVGKVKKNVLNREASVEWMRSIDEKSDWMIVRTRTSGKQISSHIAHISWINCCLHFRCAAYESESLSSKMILCVLASHEVCDFAVISLVRLDQSIFFMKFDNSVYFSVYGSLSCSLEEFLICQHSKFSSWNVRMPVCLSMVSSDKQYE